MPIELHSFGWIIDGPKSEHWVTEKPSAKIRELAAAEGCDEDDYAATEIYAPAWRGSIDEMPSNLLIEAVRAAINPDRDIAIAQAIEFAQYVEEHAKGKMEDAAKHFLSLPYAKELAGRIKK